MSTFAIRPRGPFSLAAAQDFAGGFPPGIGGGEVGEKSVAMAFPLEGTDSSAAVEISQRTDGVVIGRTDASSSLLEQVQRQAARSLSLDHDGAGWPDVGRRDPVTGRLQEAHGYLRPVCFYSAYEAATSFVIGQRISMRQGAVAKKRLGEELGDRPTVDGNPYVAFPRPERLLEAREVRGLNEKKVGWLHGLSRAALDGVLDTEALRGLPFDEALARLRAIPGVGPFTAEAVLLRGCGMVDAIPSSEDLSLQAAADLYTRPGLDRAGFLELAENWRPYRMWAVVLLRMGWNREGGPRSYRQ
ncbi:MAG TPA: DNA-3-methyladenine glycosylase 2 family protein [Candidatus Limnocylindria bacterium]|nr:DNA-3-methyladenine glycosylase 2 family protein [Candidatus Limnocylindria bacterium]